MRGGPAVGDKAVLAALHAGDVELPKGSASYVLFPGKLTSSMADADFVS